MQTRSYGSVTVFKPEPLEIFNALDSYVQELKQREEILGVWLIGSYHRKDFGPFSDVDLVLIVRETAIRFLDRSTEYMPQKFPVAVDLFVYTIAETEEMKKSGHFFWADIEKSHTVLFERS